MTGTHCFADDTALKVKPLGEPSFEVLCVRDLGQTPQAACNEHDARTLDPDERANSCGGKDLDGLLATLPITSGGRLRPMPIRPFPFLALNVLYPKRVSSLPNRELCNGSRLLLSHHEQ